MGPVGDHGAGHPQCTWWLSDWGVWQGSMAQALTGTELQRLLARRCKGHGRPSEMLREEPEEPEPVMAVKRRAGDTNTLVEQVLRSRQRSEPAAQEKD